MNSTLKSSASISTSSNKLSPDGSGAVASVSSAKVPRHGKQKRGLKLKTSSGMSPDQVELICVMIIINVSFIMIKYTDHWYAAVYAIFANLCVWKSLSSRYHRLVLAQETAKSQVELALKAPSSSHSEPLGSNVSVSTAQAAAVEITESASVAAVAKPAGPPPAGRYQMKL